MVTSLVPSQRLPAHSHSLSVHFWGDGAESGKTWRWSWLASTVYLTARLKSFDWVSVLLAMPIRMSGYLPTSQEHRMVLSQVVLAPPRGRR